MALIKGYSFFVDLSKNISSETQSTCASMNILSVLMSTWCIYSKYRGRENHKGKWQQNNMPFKNAKCNSKNILGFTVLLYCILFIKLLVQHFRKVESLLRRWGHCTLFGYHGRYNKKNNEFCYWCHIQCLNQYTVVI